MEESYDFVDETAMPRTDSPVDSEPTIQLPSHIGSSGNSDSSSYSSSDSSSDSSNGSDSDTDDQDSTPDYPIPKRAKIHGTYLTRDKTNAIILDLVLEDENATEQEILHVMRNLVVNPNLTSIYSTTINRLVEKRREIILRMLVSDLDTKLPGIYEIVEDTILRYIQESKYKDATFLLDILGRISYRLTAGLLRLGSTGYKILKQRKVRVSVDMLLLAFYNRDDDLVDHLRKSGLVYVDFWTEVLKLIPVFGAGILGYIAKSYDY